MPVITDDAFRELYRAQKAPHRRIYGIYLHQPNKPARRLAFLRDMDPDANAKLAVLQAANPEGVARIGYGE
jgi:hypothetical protein